MNVVISLLLHSRKFWWYFFTVFFDAASRRHNDVVLTSFSVYLFTMPVNSVCQVRRITGFSAHATVELLCQEMSNFIEPNLWLHTAQISVLWITRSWLSCSVMSTRDKSILWINWQRLIDGWYILERSVFEEAIDQWRGRVRACVCAKAGHFEYSLWTDDVDFVHVCYTLCDLFDCCIFN